jgi:hypothetical protein
MAKSEASKKKLTDSQEKERHQAALYSLSRKVEDSRSKNDVYFDKVYERNVEKKPTTKAGKATKNTNVKDTGKKSAQIGASATYKNPKGEIKNKHGKQKSNDV